MPNMTSGVIPPPPGVMPNFDNPPSLAPMTIAVTIALIVVASVFVGLRGYTVLFILHARGIADYLLAIGWLLAVVCSILSCLMVQCGLGRHFWDVPFSTYNARFFKVGAIMGTFYGMSIMFTKLSILHFYLRFLVARPHLRKFVYAVMVIVVLYSFVASFEWLYACRPLKKYWDLTVTGGSCVNPGQFTIFSGVMNVVTDAIVLLFPLAILRDLKNLPPREKVAVTGILMTGGLVVGISIVRAKMNVDMLHMTDVTWDSAKLVIWWMAEMDISIICACLISLKPFLRKYFPGFLEKSHRHTPSLSFNLGRFTMPSITNRHLSPLPATDEKPLRTAS